MPADRFTAVRFPVTHPALPVRDDEVILAFHEDADAAAFRAWWEQQGAEVFAHWLKAKAASSQQFVDCPGSGCERVIRRPRPGETVQCICGQLVCEPKKGA